jgi:hypothetical protein
MTLTTTKITMVNGNWTRVPVILSRKGNGYVETGLPVGEVVKTEQVA